MCIFLSGCSNDRGSAQQSAQGQSSSSANSPATQCAQSCTTQGQGGQQKHSDSSVTVKTGVQIMRNGAATSYSDAIEITVHCSNSPHVLQFINREIIESNGKARAQTMRTTGGTYQTTTDPSKPNWNTDSAAKPVPYYEAGGLNCSCPDRLIVWDQPSLLPVNGETWNANFKAFIYCNGKVIREVQWSRTQSAGGSPSYSVKVSSITQLPQWARDVLKAQGYASVP
jgi:hypothetical protein